MGSTADRGADVVVVVPLPHPSAGLANRCAALCSAPPPLFGFPIATMLPSLFTATWYAKSVSDVPVAAVSRAAVDVAAHPGVGFVNTYADPYPKS